MVRELVEKQHLDNCIKSLRMCVIKRKPKIVLDRGKISDLQFSIAITKVCQAIDTNVISKKKFLYILGRK